MIPFSYATFGTDYPTLTDLFGDSSNEFGQVVNSDLQIANRGRRDEFVNKEDGGRQNNWFHLYLSLVLQFSSMYDYKRAFIFYMNNMKSIIFLDIYDAMLDIITIVIGVVG